MKIRVTFKSKCSCITKNQKYRIYTNRRLKSVNSAQPKRQRLRLADIDFLVKSSSGFKCKVRS